MPAPPWAGDYTGAVRIRRTLLGRMVVQVEVPDRAQWDGRIAKTRWKNASERDLGLVDALRAHRGGSTLAGVTMEGAGAERPHSPPHQGSAGRVEG